MTTKTSEQVALDHLEGRLPEAPSVAALLKADRDAYNLLVENCANWLQRCERLERALKVAEGKILKARRTFGLDLFEGGMVRISEVTEQALTVRDYWRTFGAHAKTFEVLDDFVTAVNGMEGEPVEEERELTREELLLNQADDRDSGRTEA